MDEGRKAIHHNFQSESHFSHLLVRAISKSSSFQYYFFKESNPPRKNYFSRIRSRFFVNGKKVLLNNVFKFNIFENVDLFQIILVLNAAYNSEFIELYSFLMIIVKTIVFFRVVPCEKLQAVYFPSRRLAILVAEEILVLTKLSLTSFSQL